MLQALIDYPWLWLIVAGLLLIGELLMPGVFLLWLAVAAALTAVFSFVAAPGWAMDVAFFSVASVVLVMLTWRWEMRRRNRAADEPYLNQRHAGYVGQTYVLDKDIRNGHGRLRIEDVLWDVDGPDLPAGATVRVTALRGTRLVVEAA